MRRGFRRRSSNRDGRCALVTAVKMLTDNTVECDGDDFDHE